MDKKKVLIVTQEMTPYSVASEISRITRELPQYCHENGLEMRVLMPRFGTINERRHRLHEVVRLSGMNIIVDEDDYPLIIKVASLPNARLQVYFLDNDDFFRRKSTFADSSGKPHADNADRMVFFCKGVMETIKKFGWPPNLIHCHGWMTSLIPFYLKTAYKDDTIFAKSKVVYSLYEEYAYEEKFSADTFLHKAAINDLTVDDLAAYRKEGGINLQDGASKYADGVILGSESLNGVATKKITDLGKPMLTYQGKEKDAYCGAYFDFYNNLMED